MIYNDGKIMETLIGYFLTTNNMINNIMEKPICIMPRSYY